MKPIFSLRATEHDIAEINSKIRVRMDQPLEGENYEAVGELLAERERREAELRKLEAIE